MSDFRREGGGHRWQRIPPTERGGRVHTSTVTVAVIVPEESTFSLDLRDVEFSATLGSGAGGQARQKVSSCVIAVHRPTGERVRVETERSQSRNRQTAIDLLTARLSERESIGIADRENDKRRRQVGSGERGDKVRTYRTRDNQVNDHRTGNRWTLTKWMNGEW